MLMKIECLFMVRLYGRIQIKKGEQSCMRSVIRDRDLCCHLFEMRSFYGNYEGKRIKQAVHFEAMTILMCFCHYNIDGELI